MARNIKKLYSYKELEALPDGEKSWEKVPTKLDAGNVHPFERVNSSSYKYSGRLEVTGPLIIGSVDVANTLSNKSNKGDSYTKAESDNKYPLKTASYTKTESDGRYYTKTDSDNKYALNTASYTKADSDNRYYTKAQSDAAIKDIKIGGTNVLSNALKKTTNASYILSSYTLNDTIQEGETMTIQIKGTLGSDRSSWLVHNSGGSMGLITFAKGDIGSDGIYTGTFTWKVGTTSNTYINLYQYPNSGTSSSTVEWIKIERGNQATARSEGPWDLTYNNDTTYPGLNNKGEETGWIRTTSSGLLPNVAGTGSGGSSLGSSVWRFGSAWINTINAAGITLGGTNRTSWPTGLGDNNGSSYFTIGSFKVCFGMSRVTVTAANTRANLDVTLPISFSSTANMRPFVQLDSGAPERCMATVTRIAANKIRIYLWRDNADWNDVHWLVIGT